MQSRRTARPGEHLRLGRCSIALGARVGCVVPFDFLTEHYSPVSAFAAPLSGQDFLHSLSGIGSAAGTKCGNLEFPVLAWRGQISLDGFADDRGGGYIAPPPFGVEQGSKLIR